MSKEQIQELRTRIAADNVKLKQEIAQRAEMRARGEIDDLPLIRKTYIPEVEEETPLLPRVQGTMTREASAQWNAWLHTGIRNALTAHDDQFRAHLTARDEMICGLVAEVVGREVKKLHELIGSLRAEVNVLHGVTKGQIVDLKGKTKDAAA